MKKHMKKWLAAIAAALVACSVTACTPAATSSKGAASGSESKTDVSSKADEAPVTLKYINYGAKPEAGDCDRVWAKLNELLLQNVNCTMDVEYLGSGDLAQMKLKFAGNEEFDFCFSSSWWGFYDNAKANAYLELSDEMIQTNMPYASKQIPNIAWQQGSVGGKKYMVPQSYGYNGTAIVGYRGDLLERYGMKELETLDDLEAYMTKVAENEPGMIASNTSGMKSFYLTYKNGWAPGNDSLWTYKLSETENPEMFHAVMQDEYLDYAKKMREFYTKGFWPSDLINDMRSQDDKLPNGTLAIYAHNPTTVNARLLDNSVKHPEWKLKMFNPYKGAATINDPYANNGWSLHRTTTHADQVLQTIDYIYSSEDAQKLLGYGFEGDSYKMDGQYLVPIVDATGDKKHDLGCNWNTGNAAITDTFLRPSVYENYEEIYSDIKAHVIENPLQAFTFDSANVVTEVANMAGVIKNNNALNYGMVEDVEGAVEKFRSDLKEAGYEKVKAEYDRQIKEFMSTYKK